MIPATFIYLGLRAPKVQPPLFVHEMFSWNMVPLMHRSMLIEPATSNQSMERTPKDFASELRKTSRVNSESIRERPLKA